MILNDMKVMNVIAVYDRNREHVLMCIRSKNPYKGKLNFVGGKVEPGEDGVTAAYRELEEETGYKAKDIDDFEDKIIGVLEEKLPDLTEEGYKVAKERDIKKIGKQLKEAYEEAMKS